MEVWTCDVLKIDMKHHDTMKTFATGNSGPKSNACKVTYVFWNRLTIT